MRTASDQWSHLSELGQCEAQSSDLKVLMTVKHKGMVCYGNMSPAPHGHLDRKAFVISLLLSPTQFCWHPDLSMQFAAFTAERPQTPQASPKLSGAAPGHSLNRVSRRIMQATKPSKSMVSLVLQA